MGRCNYESFNVYHIRGDFQQSSNRAPLFGIKNYPPNKSLEKAGKPLLFNTREDWNGHVHISYRINYPLLG